MAAILALVLPFSGSVSAAWKQSTFVDRLTGAKTIRSESRALAPVNIHGRATMPVLTLSCVRYSDSTSQIGVFIMFEQVVSFVDTTMRWRFDDGPAEERSVGASPRGTYFQITDLLGEFIDPLKQSSRLRVELKLPQTDAFMEFNTKGAADAVKKAPANRL